MAPLAGIRVIDAATNIAGPYGASLLADFGAEVIKVEPLRGDPVRGYAASQFAAVNHDKQYVALDLRTDEGRATLHRLAAGADVLIQNARAGHESKLGLDAARCHAANPRLVHVTVAAFHPADGDRPGYDLLVQAESGLLEQTGEADRPPSRIGASAIDHATGLWVAFGALAALQGDRDRVTLRASMLDVAVGLLNEKVAAHVVTGQHFPRMGSGTYVTTPHGAFATADADIVIGAPTDANYARLADVLGIDDERFATQAGRLAARAELEAQIGAALAAHGADHWVRVLSEAGVAVTRVATLPEAVARHRAHSRTGLRPIDGDDTLEVVAPAISVNDQEWAPLQRPGEVGADNDAVLGALIRMTAPLAGVRVVDFCLYLPGPYTTRLLSDLGAEVVKIEPPSGDPITGFLPGVYDFLNRGKRVEVLNLKDDGDRARAHELVAAADVVLEGFRPGVADRLGIGFADCAALRPGLVYVSLSGYGQTGPDRQHPGHDIGYEAGGGAYAAMLALGDDLTPPHVAVGDLGGSLFASTTICAHLAARGADAVHLDVALQEAVTHLSASRWAGALRDGEQVRPSELASFAPGMGFFRTSDARWVALASVEDKFWAGTCAALAAPDLAAFDSHPARMRSRTRLRARLASLISEMTLDDLRAALRAHDVPLDLVRAADEVMADPHLRERGMFVAIDGGLHVDYPVVQNGRRSWVPATVAP